MNDEIANTESDVGGGLNDRLNDLCYVLIFVSKQMIAKNGLFELGQCQRICDESFASRKIHGNAINREPFQIMKAQMSDGIEHHGNGSEIFCDDIIPLLGRHHGELQLSHIGVQLNKETRLNFATTQHIAWFTWHAASVIFAHPLQIVRIVSTSFKLASVPGPEALALRAEHLITSLGFVNGNLAVGTGFGVRLEKRNGCNGVGIAHMIGIIAIGFEFAAVRTGEFVTGGAFPSGRHEAIAVGISTAMYELISGIGGSSGRVVTLQLTFCLHEIVFVGDEGFDLCIDNPDLIINVPDELVMNDERLSGRKHGLFLGEENVLLMLGEFALKKGLGEAEVLQLRMRELRVAEEALWNRYTISAQKGLIAGTAGSLGTGIKRATNRFAIGGIEAVKADGTDCI